MVDLGAVELVLLAAEARVGRHEAGAGGGLAAGPHAEGAPVCRVERRQHSDEALGAVGLLVDGGRPHLPDDARAAGGVRPAERDLADRVVLGGADEALPHVEEDKERRIGDRRAGVVRLLGVAHLRLELAEDPVHVVVARLDRQVGEAAGGEARAADPEAVAHRRRAGGRVAGLRPAEQVVHEGAQVVEDDLRLLVVVAVELDSPLLLQDTAEVVAGIELDV